MKNSVEKFNNTLELEEERLSKLEDLTDDIIQYDLVDFYRTFHPTEYTLLKRAHGTLSRVGYMLAH